MKLIAPTAILVAIWLTTATAAATLPNIVFILADDVGRVKPLIRTIILKKRRMKNVKKVLHIYACIFSL